jgi:hypothetical protein
MKLLLAFLFSALLITLPCLAQKTVPAGVGGFGNVLHPGTGGSVIGYGPGAGNRANRPRQGHGGGSSAGYGGGYSGGFPIYIGGAYVPAYSSGYAQDYSSQTQLNPQQQYAPAPPVVINQYFGPAAPAEPVTSFYQPSAGRPSAAQDEISTPEQGRNYLLAFKDHSVYSALAYWVEDKTLHYVTPQNTHNQASLDLVDVEFTKQLNQDRAVPFSISTPAGSAPRSANSAK